MKQLQIFTKFKVIQALIFLMIPFVLWIVLGERLESISAYAYYAPMTFALCLSLAGALFFYDGIVDKTRNYNIIIGISLFGVVLFPHIEHTFIHYSFAVLFFLGSLFNMIYFSSNKERFFKIITASVVIFGMLGTFLFNWYSVFFAEWFGMIPISIHYILEALNKID